MDRKEYYDNCEKCGRPIRRAPATPKCNYNDCCLNEYCHPMPACIRNKKPDCMAKAVIPATTVETVDGITNLANCFVHVTNINTTFYIDDKHRPMMVWAGDVEISLPIGTTEEEAVELIRANARNLRSQYLYVKMFNEDTNTDEIWVAYYDKGGKAYNAGFYSELGVLI